MSDSLRSVVKMLIHRLEITRGYLLPGYSEADQNAQAAIAFAEAALAAEPPAPAIGPEWRPCVKLPITVHVRDQRPDETHVSTREGITPVRPDDLIMRGVQGEEYPIGRDLFNRTYRLGAADPDDSAPAPPLLCEPTAPAPAIPIDLDALLSPEGAYEPGTGQEDGAQLVDQLEWWAPVHGCETLENLLDRIRGRILPHLRPPIAGIDVPGSDGDYGNVLDLCAAEGVDPRVGVPLLKRALDVWKAAAQPPALAEPDTDAVLALAAIIRRVDGSHSLGAAALAESILSHPGVAFSVLPPAPAPAADGEREEREGLAQWMEDEVLDVEENGHTVIYDRARLTRAAALLRQPAPAPVPVPVAERPWEREGWCDAEGFLWLWDSDRRWVRQTGTAGACNTWTGSFALPHWAIPQPPRGGEVEP